MIGSPNNLDVLLHCYVTFESNPRNYAPAVQEAYSYLVTHGMLTGNHKITAKGEFYIKHLMAVPFPEPVQGWVIPEQQAIP